MIRHGFSVQGIFSTRRRDSMSLSEVFKTIVRMQRPTSPWSVPGDGLWRCVDVDTGTAHPFGYDGNQEKEFFDVCHAVLFR